MSESTIAKVYAEALFLLATDRERRDILDPELRDLATVFRDHRDIYNFFASPSTPREDKDRLIDATLAPQLDPVTVGFLKLLVRKGREMFIDRILAGYRELVDAAQGRISVRITSATPLDDDVAPRIASEISRMTSHQVDLQTAVDTRLIGGMTVRMGNRLLDTSLRTRLRRLREQILEG